MGFLFGIGLERYEEEYFGSNDLKSISNEGVLTFEAESDLEIVGEEEYSGEIFDSYSYYYEEYIYTLVDLEGNEFIVDEILILRENDLVILNGGAWDINR